MSNGAAIYLRLSREDRDLDISESISNQRMQLMQYAETHGIHIDAIFSDDGVSGTRWEREGLHAMLRAIEDGWIQTVLVKDLSRLSRDYIRTGELLEQWFPAHGVRLISVGDVLDTDVPSAAMDYSPFRAVMDDWYARDISRKVRAAIYARQKAGFCTSASLPYGYIRGEDGIHTAHTDVITRIFDLYEHGMSCCGIANTLSRLRIAPPNHGNACWNDVSVRNILCNPAYTGRLRLHTTQKISYKCGKRKRLPESEGVVYEVPQIIPLLQFERVQEMMQKRAHIPRQQHWASGRIFCGCCGARYMLAHERGGIRLICGGRKRGSKCGNPSVLLKRLLEDITSALTEGCIPMADIILPQIAERIVLFPEQAEVYLRCASSQ